MDKAVQRALERDRTIDITTTGRKTRQPRRKEIWFHNVEGHLYITGTPGDVTGMPTCWRIPSLLSTSSRVCVPTSQLGPLPSWIRSDDERFLLRFTRNSAAREIWRRGSREAPWWKWNSLVCKRAAPAFERLWGPQGRRICTRHGPSHRCQSQEAPMQRCDDHGRKTSASVRLVVAMRT